MFYGKFTQLKRTFMRDMFEELLDLVDADDNVIGVKSRDEIYAEHLKNFRVINVFLVNSKGEIWIPRRTATKKLYPLCLDMSVGGHVQSGESYDEAFHRETFEELNINTAEISVRLLGHLTPALHDVSAFMNVYEIQTDETPKYNPDDVMEGVWISPDELQQRIAAGEKVKSDLPKLLKIFFSHAA